MLMISSTRERALKTSPRGRGRGPRPKASGKVRGYSLDGLAQRTLAKPLKSVLESVRP